MRTVTFSNASVGKALSRDFICAWENRIDGFHDCSALTENTIFRTTPDVYTTRNICTFFLTPDLQILHYMSGYFSPELFQKEMAFALELRDALFTTDLKETLTGARKQFVKLHKKRAKQLRRRAPRLQSVVRPANASYLGATGERESDDAEEDTGPTAYDRQKHYHRARCMMEVRSAYEYIAKVHEDLANGGRGAGNNHAARRGGLQTCRTTGAEEVKTLTGVPVLSDLRANYLFGNPFAEESAIKKLKRPAQDPEEIE